MALVLEIDHLMGVAFAARGPDSDMPDWPPQPDRVFSALVAAWAGRGGLAEEREALEWLERQAPPSIVASGYSARPAPMTFVPPNDPATGRSGDRTVMPALRRRQPRRFPAALPHEPIVQFVWDEEPPPATSSALEDLARDVAYIGHSASLTRCRFLANAQPPSGQPARRRIYPGRLAQLETAFRSGVRPTAGDPNPPPVAVSTAGPRSDFSPDWIVLSFVRNDGAPPTPDVRSAPMLCRALIKALMSGYGAINLVPPAWVCGHAPDGSPTRDPHLAAAPLTFSGYAHADGGLHGLALIPPRGGPDPRLDKDFVRAFNVLRQNAERHLVLAGRGLSHPIPLALASDDVRKSLKPERYAGASCRWATVTPILLDRHFKTELGGAGANLAREAEIEALIGDACERIGLPRHSRIAAGKHSAVTGAVSAEPSGRSPSWGRWALPASASARPLRHAVLHFDQPVEGPVLLGAGRFYGLGLCLPLDQERAG